jgi:hypothetical protein
MSKRVTHLAPDALAVLRQTASRMEGVELEEVIAAALWAFGTLDPLTRNMLIEDYWSREMFGAAFRVPAFSWKEKLREVADRVLALFRRSPAATHPGQGLLQEPGRHGGPRLVRRLA